MVSNPDLGCPRTEMIAVADSDHPENHHRLFGYCGSWIRAYVVSHPAFVSIGDT